MKNKILKIGIFTECYKPILNGVVNSISGFKEGLEKLGCKVYVFCPDYKPYKPKEKNVIYCKSIKIPGKSGYHYIYPLDNKIKNIAKKMDIIHVQHPFIMGSRAISVSKKYNIPLVFTNHTQYDQYLHYIPFSKKFIKKKLIDYIKNFTKKVDLIIAPAYGIKKKLLIYGVKNNIEIVPNGINIKNFSKKSSFSEMSNLKIKYKINPKDEILIFVGRIAKEKNLTFLIKSFQKVLCKKPNTALILVGGGVEIDKYNNLVKNLNLNKKVIITDYVTYEDVNIFLNISKFFVTASKSEVHPLTLLEAMASGLPCVIVDAPGTRDIIINNKNGLIAKNSVNDFAEKIVKLLNDKKLLSKLSISAIKNSKKYSYLETSKKMLKVYNQLLKNKENI